MNPLRLLERLPPYRRLLELVEDSERQRARKKHEQIERWKRLQEAQEAARHIDYQVRVLGRRKDDA